jgi:hypothetical protein
MLYIIRFLKENIFHSIMVYVFCLHVHMESKCQINTLEWPIRFWNSSTQTTVNIRLIKIFHIHFAIVSPNFSTCSPKVYENLQTGR